MGQTTSSRLREVSRRHASRCDYWQSQNDVGMSSEGLGMAPSDVSILDLPPGIVPCITKKSQARVSPHNHNQRVFGNISSCLTPHQTFTLWGGSLVEVERGWEGWTSRRV